MTEPSSKTRVLVVDDEPDVIETIQFGLEMEGYNVTTAANGLEALGAIRVHVPDLVVLDVMLPGENGYRVAHLVREDEASPSSSSPPGTSAASPSARRCSASSARPT